ncbi:hypothetical protein TNCV_4939691 [Trichonephila clavipes]|nr:hypothetical protein TNCV_4939691 [Trichonephila clavipes]
MRGALIRSPPGSWSEPNRKLKMSRKETLGYKRSFNSGCGGPEMKHRKGQKHQGEKRQLTLSNNNCDRLAHLFFNMSFGFFGAKIMATIFQPNPRSEV